MSDAYTTLEAIWKRHISGDASNTENGLIALLHSEGVRLRQDNGELKQLTVSRPTSVASAFVIGLRYEKRDGTPTEDLFSVEEGHRIEPHYKAALERKWPEYRGTHRQQIPLTLVVDVKTPITSVNTINLLSRQEKSD
jgi:hypothetical protein